MLKRLILSIVFALILSSCSAYNNINVNNLELGMSQSSVENVLGYPLLQVSNSIDEKGQSKEVFQVQKRIVRGGIARQQRYNLFFINDSLVKYEKESENFSF